MMDINPPGFTHSHARAINNNGDIIVNTFAPTPQGCFLFRGGQHVNLGTLGGATAGGTDISNSGYITGQSAIATAPNPSHAFRVFAGAPPAKLKIAGGNVLIASPGEWLIVRSPNGSFCIKIGIDNAGAMTNVIVSCP